MPRETRAQKARREAQEAEAQAQNGQQTTHPEIEQPSQQPGTVPSLRRNRRGIPENGQRARPSRNQPRNRRLRSRRTATEHDRPNRERVSPAANAANPLRQVRSGIRRRGPFRWQGTWLPRFGVPHWTLRHGLPTLLLPLLGPTDDTNAAGENLDDIEDILIDRQSDHSTPDDDGNDEQAQENPYPPSSQEPPGQEHPQEPIPEPPQEPAQEPPQGPAQEPVQEPLQQPPQPPRRPQRRRRQPLQPQPPQTAGLPTLAMVLDPGARPREGIQPSQWNQPAAPPSPDPVLGSRRNPVSVHSKRLLNIPLKWYPTFYRDNPVWDVKDLRQPLEGEAREDEVAMYGERQAKFIRSDLYGKRDAPDASAWYGVKPLGRGGFGMAGLWEKRDENGEVVDHLVIKQIGKEPGLPWNSDIPNEAVVMEEVRKHLTGNTGIVHFRAYKRYPRREVHRLYMEYCPHGDLHQLIAEYRAKKRFLPTAFIWDVFHQLALACQSLEAIPPQAEKTADNRERVHRDIKPANVFLAKPRTWDENGMEIYPTAKLGDFGLAIATGPADADNPRQYRGAGTPGYMPLEQEAFLHPSASIVHHTTAYARFQHLVSRESRRGAHPRLLSPTNVWSVGATIFELCTLKQARYYLYTGLGDDALEALPDDLLTAMEQRYPSALVQLVARCLRPNQRERVGVQELVEVTGQERDAWLEEMTKERGEEEEEEGLQGAEEIPWGRLAEMDEGSWVQSQGQDEGWWARGKTWETEVKREPEPEPEDEPSGEDDEDDDDDDQDPDEREEEEEDEEQDQEDGEDDIINKNDRNQAAAAAAAEYDDEEEPHQDPPDEGQEQQQQQQRSSSSSGRRRNNRPWERQFDNPVVEFDYPESWSQRKRFWMRPDQL